MIHSLRRCWFLASRLFAGVFLLWAASSLMAAKSPPNIVVIYADDLGYGDIGVFGARGFETPNLDRLARDGRIFRNFHVVQPVCSASRAALLTGCYPNRIGIHGALGPGAKTGISSNEVTLAELVKQKGYATAIFGKWHLGDAPQFLPRRHGFDQYFGLPYSNDMWPLHPEANKPTATGKRRRGFPDLPLIENEKVIIPKVTAKEQEQLTTWYTERAVRFIETNKDCPFFLYVAHNMPHVPLHVSDKYRGRSKRGLYGDVIQEVDWSVGEITKALAKNGLEKNTLVIFTSDNGPWLSYGDHAGSAGSLREGKGTCWEGGIRVPCIMRWPEQIPHNTESQAMFANIDLFPTIAKLVDAKLPEHRIDGKDVWSLIAGKGDAANPHSAYWFYYARNELQAIMSGDGRWKLQLPHGYSTLNGRSGGRDGVPTSYQPAKVAKPELYDLVKDVGETTDVAETHPEVVKKLEAEAERAREELGDALTDRTGKAVREPGMLVTNETGQ